jgi:preprotein translocase subunit SecA
MRRLERVILLRVVDEYWMGAHRCDARAPARHRPSGLWADNPLDEYKREGFDMYETMVNGIKDEVVRRLFIVEVKKSSRSNAKGYRRLPWRMWEERPCEKQPIKAGKKVGRK